MVIFPDEALFLLSFEPSKVQLQQQFELVKQTCYEVPDKNNTDSAATPTFPSVILQLLIEFQTFFTAFLKALSFVFGCSFQVTKFI